MAEDKFLEQLETVTILRPMKSIYPRGWASSREQAPAHAVRYPPETLDDIKKAAAICGVTASEFIRWTAHAAALVIIKEKKEYDKRHS